MIDSIYRISLDINEHGSQAVVKAKKTDTGRKLHITLRAGGMPYTIEDNCYAVFTATKPDGSILYNACTIEGNEIVYEFTEQTCTAVGRCPCEIKLYGLDDKLITSPRFALLVDGTVYPDGRVESRDEFSALTALVSETLEVSKDTKEATENANQAAEEALLDAQRAADASIEADDAAARANAAEQKANTATGSANQAATAATQAAQSANAAAGAARYAADGADEAAITANKATEAANGAASNANQAATKAAHTAKSLMVIGKAAGTAIHLDDAIEQFLVGCRIFGKTTQDGTPTPDAPVDLVSVGDSGSITVNVTGENDTQSMTVTTPNGLPGIPVESGGNYTDANGQQWVCDEIDLARGVHVQRVGVIEYNDNTISGPSSGVTNTAGKVRWVLARDGEGTEKSSMLCPMLCSVIAAGSADDTFLCKNSVAIDQGGLVFLYLDELSAATSDQAFVWLKEKRAKVQYTLATPIETPLSAEELAAYSSLHTYRGHTTVLNDASAHMELEYVMDAKKYIDGLMTGAIIPATVE